MAEASGGQKTAIQAYSLLSGVNQKASEVSVGLASFLNLRNLDFDVPNALSKRPGMTQAITANTSGPLNSVFEFQRLDGSSWVVTGSDSAMFYRAGAAGLTLLDSGWNNGQPTDMLTFVNKLWLSNGQKFAYWNSTFMIEYPKAIPFPFAGVTGVAAANTWWGVAGPLRLFFFAAYRLADETWGPLINLETNITAESVNNNLGPTDPALPNGIVDVTAKEYILRGGYTLIHSATFQALPYSNPYTLGVSSIGFFAYPRGGTLPTIDESDLPNFVLFATFALAPTLAAFAAYDTYGYTALKTQMITDQAVFNGASYTFANTYTPKYIDVNQNVLFASGFSGAASVIKFTDVGQPLNSAAEFSIEVRTNDGDVIRGHKTYNNQTIVLKENSFHKIIGVSPEEFELIELSTEYGCISDKTIIEYQEKLLFLDKKGIVEYNGASWDIISVPVEDVFRRMNLSAAREKACAVHQLYRNQVWFGIPVDGATQNNITVVYDYLVKAWTFFDGFNPASFALVQGELTKPTVWMGNYSGVLRYFSESFYGDNGQGITCLAYSAWEHGQQNETWIWRRLFLDVATVSGVTGTITGKLFSNYNTGTVQATFSMFQDAFQSRAEIGLPGKACAFEVAHNSASLPLLINGYTWARRFLRNV